MPYARKVKYVMNIEAVTDIQVVFLYPDQERMSDSSSRTKWSTNRINDTMRRNTMTNQNTAQVHK